MDIQMGRNTVSLTGTETKGLFDHLEGAGMASAVERLGGSQSFTRAQKRSVLSVLRDWEDRETTETFTPGLTDLRNELMRELEVPPFNN